MELFLPRERLLSVRDFFLRYLLIVAGILTALAVNQWRDNRAEARLAAETEAAIRQELAANGKNLKESIQETVQRLDRIRRINNALRKPKSLKDATLWLKQETGSMMEVQLSFPTLHRAAWGAAAASGALRRMPPAVVEQYSEVYASLEDFRTVFVEVTTGSLGPIVDTASALLNQDGTLADLRRGFMLVEAVQSMLIENQKELLKEIEAAIGPVPSPAEGERLSPATTPATK